MESRLRRTGSATNSRTGAAKPTFRIAQDYGDSALKLRVRILCTVTVIRSEGSQFCSDWCAKWRSLAESNPCFSLERAGRATPAAQHHVDEHASSPVAHHPQHQGCSCGTAPFRFRGPKLVAGGASVHFLQKLAHRIELRAEAFPISGLQSLHCLIVAIKRLPCLICRRACGGPLLCRG